jgi:hypothetical protein
MVHADLADIAPGDSVEQRKAEPLLLAALGARLGVSLSPRKYSVAGSTRVEIDGACEDPLVLCEAFAHYGVLKSAQRHKLITDAFKLVYVERLLELPARKIILLACDQAASCVIGRSWAAAALRSFGVEVQVVGLPSELEASIRAAQKRQYR